MAILRRHLEHHDTGSDGHLFVARLGPGGTPLTPPCPRPVSMSTIYRAWHRARDLAFTPAQAASTLARRPYALRHTCLSSWLNAGVPASQIATWAGHSTAVLLTVYAHCVEGQAEVAKQLIEAAIRPAHSVAPIHDNPRQLPQACRLC